jgi:hypothetical protein
MINERRFTPRVITDFEAELVNAKGERGEGLLCNLSLGGLLVRGDATLPHLTRQPQTAPGAPFTPIDVEVRFVLPAGEETAPVALPCRHMHTRRVARDVFELGFKILVPEDAQPAAFVQYMRNATARR